MALLSKPSSNDGDHPGSQLPLGSPVSLSQFFAAASGDPAQASADADADADSDFDADTAIDPTAAAQLERFCLRLVDHPRLLVCTRKQCLLKLPLMPTFKEVSTHLKMQHHHALVASSKQVLVDVLETLDLDHPASVRINSSLLPVPIIKELDVTYQGYRCSLCPYTIKSKSAMHTHMHTHRDEEVKATYIHPVPMQVIYEGGQNRRYLHVINKELDPTPPTAILPAAAIADVDRAVQVKVWEMLRQNAQNMQDAKVDKPGVLPLTFTGNLGPWAKQLDWHTYWAGKQVAAVGKLGPNPQHWPGRQVQQMFHAHSAEVSQPYSLNDSTIKKRADMWAFMLALLVHLFLDGDVGSYAGQQSMEDHLCLDESVVSAVMDLRDFYNMEVEDDGDVFGNYMEVEKAAEQLLQLSEQLIKQKPAVYGQTEQLTLVRLFLHLCVSKDGTIKPVNAATSIIVSLEFAQRAVLHAKGLGLQGKPRVGATVKHATFYA